MASMQGQGMNFLMKKAWHIFANMSHSKVLAAVVLGMCSIVLRAWAVSSMPSLAKKTLSIMPLYSVNIFRVLSIC